MRQTDKLTDRQNKTNVHEFLTIHTIWLIIKVGPDILAINIFKKFGEDRMKTDLVNEQTKMCDRLTD